MKNATAEMMWRAIKKSRPYLFEGEQSEPQRPDGRDSEKQAVDYVCRLGGAIERDAIEGEARATRGLCRLPALEDFSRSLRGLLEKRRMK